MEEPSRGGRKRSQLRAHAGPTDEYSAETLGMAGGPQDRFGTWILQILDTAFMASQDVTTALDVTKPSVVSRVLSLTGVHGHVVAASAG